MSKLKLSAQDGQALALTLIILAIGVLLIPVFLSHASTNLFASRATEEGMKEQYAADAGVENAIWNLLEGLEVPEEGWPLDEFTINSKTVSVTIKSEDAGWQVFKITSTATSDDESSTTIVSYVYVPLDYSWFFDYTITSRGDVTIQPGSVVTGGIRSPDWPSCPGLEEEECIEVRYDDWEDDEVVGWPTAEQLFEFYEGQVDVSTPYLDPIPIDVITGTVAIPYDIGPLYYVGDGQHPLRILSTGDYAMAVLTGTIYVVGPLNIGGQKEFTLDLNGQTIYVEGTINIGGKCTITGSGCIIAEGDPQDEVSIFFEPKIESNPADFLFIMSIEGTSKINPGGSIYGAVAGYAEVTLQPDCKLTLTEPPEDGLNFPEEEPMRILTWRIGAQ